jgi:hypothetical protein
LSAGVRPLRRVAFGRRVKVAFGRRVKVAFGRRVKVCTQNIKPPISNPLKSGRPRSPQDSSRLERGPG